MDTTTFYAKLAAVPMAIKNQLGSEATIDVQDAIEHQFNLPDDSSATIGKLLQKLQIKEIDPDYFTGELAVELKLERDKALSVSAEIKKSILFPVKSDLLQYGIDISSLDKFQMPGIKPLIPASVAPSPSAPAPKIISETFSATPKFSGTPLASNRDIAAPAPKPPQPPQPPKPSDAGWSKATPQQPVVKLGAITSGATGSMPAPSSAAAPAPKTISMPTAPTTTTPAMPGAKPAARSMSEFERLDLVRKGGAPATPTPPIPRQIAPAPAPAPSIPKPATPPQPAPVMLHQVTSFAPIESSSSAFNAKRPAQDQLRGTTAQGPLPSRPAMVEFNNAATPGALRPPLSPTGPTATPPPAPMANTGPRQMTEIQAPRPAAPTPAPMMSADSIPMPMPPTPPKPPAPPASPTPQNSPSIAATSKGKVIVKDFLGS